MRWYLSCLLTSQACLLTVAFQFKQYTRQQAEEVTEQGTQLGTATPARWTHLPGSQDVASVLAYFIQQ